MRCSASVSPPVPGPLTDLPSLFQSFPFIFSCIISRVYSRALVKGYAKKGIQLVLDTHPQVLEAYRGLSRDAQRPDQGCVGLKSCYICAYARGCAHIWKKYDCIKRGIRRDPVAPIGYCDQCVDHGTSRETSVKWERRGIALRELCTAAAVTIPLHHLQIAGLRLKEAGAGL